MAYIAFVAIGHTTVVLSCFIPAILLRVVFSLIQVPGAASSKPRREEDGNARGDHHQSRSEQEPKEAKGEQRSKTF